jgi:hypothetical protein
MRKFSSYGPIDKAVHYYVPRQKLIDDVMQELKGDNPEKAGHYITVWAPRQTGKSWIMQEVLSTLKDNTTFDVVMLDLQYIYNLTDLNRVAQLLARELMKQLRIEEPIIERLDDFYLLFERARLKKPLILILDEFDGLEPAAIAALVTVFRHIYNTRQKQADKLSGEKDYLLHSLALIGVRAVLGVENVKGSPFNIQRSVRIPNLTHDEVASLFNCYEQQTGQSIEEAVIARIWYEFQGQPGLTCWFGELLTQRYNQNLAQPITLEHFKRVYGAALDLLPNNTILNLVSKVKQAPYKSFVLERFQTGKKLKFSYDDPKSNFLYMNGVIDIDEMSLKENYVKFSSPYVQKRLFNAFARELFQEMDNLYDPFEQLSDTLTDETLNLRRLLERYEQYLQANREKVLKNAPRRQKDLRVFEAVFHFHLYEYLNHFLSSYDAQVQPEFPTGNGAIDLLIRHAGQLFGLELKSFANQREYQKALIQAATYSKQLGLTEITLVLFIDAVDDHNRQKFEADYTDPQTGVIVHPQFVQTG